MTKKDFFTVMIKLFGLLTVISSLFSVLPNAISFAIMEFDLASIVWLVFVVSTLVVLFLWLVLKADRLVALLKLDKGFDDDRIDFGNVKTSDLIKIGIFVIGGLLFVDNIPSLMSHTFFGLKRELNNTPFLDDNAQENFNWAISAINVALGYLLATNYDRAANWLKLER